MNNIFKTIILLGRPASGKSEVINFLKNSNSDIRSEKFHVGKIVEIDDFPMLWTWFEEDDILEKVFNKPRLHSSPDGYFLHEYFWHLLIERICFDYKKSIRDTKDEKDKITRLIEFSRGSEHGGYKVAFSHLSKELLEEAVIIYVNVPFKESLRKNRKRFNPDKPDSVLEHGLPDKKLERLYKLVDWEELPKGTTTININGIDVPYVVFENMPSKTDDPSLLEPALYDVTKRLWNIFSKK